MKLTTERLKKDNMEMISINSVKDIPRPTINFMYDQGEQNEKQQ